MEKNQTPEQLELLEKYGRAIINVIYLFVSNACNMNCKYCYVPDDIKHADKKNSLMSWELAKLTIDNLFNHLEKRKKNFMQIRFLGGEPLVNFELIQSIVDYADTEGSKRCIDVRYGMNTNATLINEGIANWLAKHENFEVIVSLDGLEDTTNSTRLMAENDRESFPEITRGIKYLIDEGKEVNINCVITSRNYEELPFFIDFLGSMGIRNIALEFASMNPEKQGISGIRCLSEDERINVLIRAHERASLYNINLSGEWKFAVSYSNRESPYFCAAGIKALVIDASGNVYPCQRLVGNPSQIITTVKENFIEEIDWKINPAYRNIILRSPRFKPKCLGCNISGIEAGGCIAGHDSNSGKCSNPRFIRKLVDFYKTLPAEKSNFNELDRKLHGMYFYHDQL